MRNLSKVYHVGCIDIDNPVVNRKAGDSQEGNGLSISLHPDAWTQIAQLGGNDTYVLTNPEPRFFDGLDESMIKDASEWCLSEGYIKKATIFRLWAYDDEVGGKIYCDFTSRQKAKEELMSDEEDEDNYIEKIEGYKFDKASKVYFASGHKADVSLINNYIAIWYAEAHGYDGVWWNEALDPDGYSAPRGVIFQGKLDRWEIRRKRSSEEDRS
jgi:hypothetical protein